MSKSDYRLAASPEEREAWIRADAAEGSPRARRLLATIERKAAKPVPAALSPDMAAYLTGVGTPDLIRMRDRAYREAARCWQEYRAYTGPAPDAANRTNVSELLLQGALYAESYWRELHNAVAARLPAEA